MFLVSAKVGPFKSIAKPQEVAIERSDTVLVGMNEAGKTVFLQALHKSADVMGAARFVPVDDYPRRNLPAYLKRHKTQPENVTTLKYALTDDEVAELGTVLATPKPPDLTFTVSCDYDNRKTFVIHDLDEAPVVKKLVADPSPALSSDARQALEHTARLRDIPDALDGVNLSEPDQKFLTLIQARIAASGATHSVLAWEAWQWLEPRVPQFLYFSDYEVLPSKSNLSDLAQRASQAASDPSG